jgi:hypothetical protein
MVDKALALTVAAGSRDGYVSASSSGWSLRFKAGPVLRQLRVGRVAEAVERRLHDRLQVAGVAVDAGDGDHHVEYLLEREVVADFVGALRRDEERSAGGEHALAILVEDGVAAVHVREQLGGDEALAGREGGDAVSFSPGVSPSTVSPAAQTASTSSV